MSSSTDGVRETIEARLNTSWNTTAIAWPGVPFDPGDSDWIDADILWGDAFPESRDDDQHNTVTGVLNLVLYTRPGGGYGALYEYADTLRDLFQHQRLSGGLRFGAASGPKQTGVWTGSQQRRFTEEEETRWLAMVLSVPFTVDETA